MFSLAKNCAYSSGTSSSAPGSLSKSQQLSPSPARPNAPHLLVQLRESSQEPGRRLTSTHRQYLQVLVRSRGGVGRCIGRGAAGC